MVMICRPKDINRMVVRCPNWVGDIVMATPLFDCLKANFPRAEIAAVIRPKASGVIKDGPWFSRMIAVNDRNWRGLKETARQIKEFKPEMGVVLPNSIRSILAVWLGGAGDIYGYRRNFRGVLLKGGPKPLRKNGAIKAIPMTEYYLEIGRWLGLKMPENALPRLYMSEQIRQQGDELLQRYGITAGEQVIGLNPGASFGSSKCWPPEYFAQLAEMLEKRLNARIILFTGPGEEPIAEAIMNQTRAKLIDATPDKVDLEGLKPLVQRCDLLITNDTGPRHYAAALGVPVVVLMGPTNPEYTFYRQDNEEVIRIDLPCSPCHKKVCPTEHECMKAITPEIVLEKSLKLLKVEVGDNEHSRV